MPDERVSTVYLGQFTGEHAEAIAKALEEAGIVWWHKQAGRLGKWLFSEWGVRLFVDRARMDEAREIVGRVAESFKDR
jgi:hypothetical protein